MECNVDLGNKNWRACGRKGGSQNSGTVGCAPCEVYTPNDLFVRHQTCCASPGQIHSTYICFFARFVSLFLLYSNIVIKMLENMVENE